jgi:cellulose synthase/poly-beta-1,6-N-acetylglucosamine synthase-like glycosyltransferase
LKKASNEIVDTTDGDCILPENWLLNISKSFTEEVDMVCGPVMFWEGRGFLNGFQTLDLLAMQAIGFGSFYHGTPILNNAANMAYRKKAYDAVGGFDNFNTPSGDDVFLLEKFKYKQRLVKGLLDNEHVVNTLAPTTWSAFIHQRLRWASKSKFYSDKLLIFFSLLGLIQNISLLFIYLGLVLVENYVLILLILVFCKWLIDFILLFLVASFFKRERVMIYFIPVQVVYPVYVIYIWVASLIGKDKWKGRIH